jgi:uncharacterized protein (TIGR00725 family)
MEEESNRMERPPRIGVIGSGGPLDERTADLARRVGAELGRRGAVLVCGGLGGVMQAAADGASRAGGTVVGLLPGDDPSRAAAGVSIPLPTGLGQARNALVVSSSESVIALAGGWGTLSEAAFCLKLGVPLLGLRDELPHGLPIERLEDPEDAAQLAIERAVARRGRSTSAECTGADDGGRATGEVR